MSKDKKADAAMAVVYEPDCACCSVPESKCEHNSENWREVNRIIHEELHR